jgi:hypothetical protein
MSISACSKPCGPVIDRARAEERGPAAAHRLEHGVAAAHVEHRLVHAGEGGRLGVLGGRRGTHRDGGFGVAAAEPVIGVADRIGEPGGDLLGLDHLPHLGRGPFELAAVVDVYPAEAPLDSLAQAGALAEGGIGGSADDEPGRHREAGGRELAEVGSLPPA